jgi:hypothetical protein
MLQGEMWVVLSDDENHMVWDRIYNMFNFKPSISANTHPFTFRIPYNVYKLNTLPDNDSYEETMRSILAECINNDEYMYALDWQHNGFRYNPRLERPHSDSKFIKDNRFDGGGYIVYYPTFYPDGDYFFFITKDFSLGYLNHPWQKKIWVFGEYFVKKIEENADALMLTKCRD